MQTASSIIKKQEELENQINLLNKQIKSETNKLIVLLDKAGAERVDLLEFYSKINTLKSNRQLLENELFNLKFIGD